MYQNILKNVPESEYNRELDDIRDLFQSFVRVMSSAVDARTPYNLTHTRHMVEYGIRFVDHINRVCREQGKEERFSETHKNEFLMSIWLHDIGKIVTPLEIMNKDTRLRQDQYTEICRRMERIEMLTEIRELKCEVSEKEKNMILEQVKELRSLTDELNHVGDIDEQRLEKIERFRNEKYIDRDGSEQPWLTEEEAASLTIRRGTLTNAEREIMEAHVKTTDMLLSKIKFPKDLAHVREWAAGHHEFLDGSGYPKGLSGDQIPYEVRMMTILDIFDALIADDRPYKPGIPIEPALDILTEMADRDGKLDSELVRLFIEGHCWKAQET